MIDLNVLYGMKGKRAIVTGARQGQIPVVGVVTAGVPILAVENQEGTLRREHIYLCPGHLSDSVPPNSCGIDDYLRIVFCLLFRVQIRHLDSRDTAGIIFQNGCHLLVGQDVRTVKLCIHDIGYSQAERIDRTVRHTDSSDERLVH